MTLDFRVPKELKPLYQNKARYKGLKGGRGSGKSWGAVDYILIKAVSNPNINIVCLRQIQKSIKHSSKKLIQDRIGTLKLTSFFEITLTEIRMKSGKGIIIFQGLQDHTADSIKSLEGFDIAFIEEAQSITEFSMDLLIPTIRKEDAELLFAWNPRYQTDAVEELFKSKSNKVLIHINYTQNPFCPTSIREEAEELKLIDIKKYNHVYLGGFVTGDELGIIREEWINSSIEAFSRANNKPSGTKRIGFDVADGTDEKGEEIKNDSNALVYFYGVFMMEIDEWFAKKDEIFISTKRVYRFGLDNNCDEVNYDNIGVGAGVGSNFNQLNAPFSHIPFTASNSPQNKDKEFKDGKLNVDMFKNLKAQAWYAIAERFIKTHNYITRGDNVSEDEMIFINPNSKHIDKLRTELSSPRWLKDGSGKMQVESKQSLKKRGILSPNIADAFIMGAFELKQEEEIIGRSRVGKITFF